MTAWCHGAAGILLARAGGLESLDTPEVQADIADALRAVLRYEGPGSDHLCCGRCGRAEALLVAGERLGRPELAEAAQTLVARLLAEKAHAGAFVLGGAPPGAPPAPGLFQGLAGVGYTLLRLARPDELPCLLLWE